MKNNPSVFYYTLLLVFIGMLASSLNNTFAQDSKPYVRIAKIMIESAELESYTAALKEHSQAAVSKEAGVLTLYAVYDKVQSTNITVFEIYASMEAYQLHIQTPHFLKYKATVKDMVKNLVLTDVIPIALETKLKK